LNHIDGSAKEHTVNTRKLFVLLATLVFTLGMAGSATAQADTQPVSVTLSDSTELCGINIYDVAGSFGSWQYNSSLGGYVNTDPNGSTIAFRYNVWVPTLLGCSVSVSFGGLSNGTDTIDTTYFTTVLSIGYSPWVGVNPANFGDPGVGAYGQLAYYDFDYTLNSVPYVSLGTYTGNIQVYVSNTI
jgi:hypothetical protein